MGSIACLGSILSIFCILSTLWILSILPIGFGGAYFSFETLSYLDFSFHFGSFIMFFILWAFYSFSAAWLLSRPLIKLFKKKENEFYKNRKIKHAIYFLQKKLKLSDLFFFKSNRKIFYSYFKELSKEEIRFLNNKKNHDYIMTTDLSHTSFSDNYDFSKKEKLENSIIEYIKNNIINEEEKNKLFDLATEFNLHLDKEKLELVIYKNKSENKKENNFIKNMAIKKI